MIKYEIEPGLKVVNIFEFNKSKNMNVLTTKDPKDPNYIWYILCIMNKDFKLKPSETVNLDELIWDDNITIISYIIINDNTYNDSSNFIHSDYLSITDKSCDTYFQVNRVYTEKEYRMNGYTSFFVNMVLTDLYDHEKSLGHETCIYSEVYADLTDILAGENTDSEDKELIDKLIKINIRFFKECGFIKVNEISDCENSCNMYFIPDLAARSIIEFFRRRSIMFQNNYNREVNITKNLQNKISKMNEILLEEDDE